MITIQQMHDICTELIDAGLGSMPIIDIDNRTRDTDYVIDEVNCDVDIKQVTIRFDEVSRGE